MNRHLVFLMLFGVLICGFSFGFNFGGGGFFVGYIPGDMIKLPINFDLKFSNGITIYGGQGDGGLGWHTGGMGGAGSTKLTDTSGNKYVLNVSMGIGYGMKSLQFNTVGIEAGLGIGSFSYTLGRIVNSDNTDIDNFKNGDSEGKLNINVNYFIVSPILKISVNVIPTMGFYGEAIGLLGYSTKGWHYETGSIVSGIDQDKYKLLINYIISAGIEWGF